MVLGFGGRQVKLKTGGMGVVLGFFQRIPDYFSAVSLESDEALSLYLPKNTHDQVLFLVKTLTLCVSDSYWVEIFP